MPHRLENSQGDAVELQRHELVNVGFLDLHPLGRSRRRLVHPLVVVDADLRRVGHTVDENGADDVEDLPGRNFARKMVEAARDKGLGVRGRDMRTVDRNT